MALLPFSLRSEPGIKRDGTMFEGNAYVNGRWVRFQRGLPRKQGGYRTASTQLNGPSRMLILQPTTGLTNVHNGWYGGVELVQINSNGQALGPPTDRTPVGFASDVNNMWSMDIVYDAAGPGALLVTAAMPTALDIADQTNGTIYAGDVNGTAALAALSPTDGPASVSGGVAFIPPYTFYFGNYGFVTWSVPNTPDDCTVADGGGGVDGAHVAHTKIVACRPMRGDGPTALILALDSVIRADFTGGATVFDFNTISDETSVLSQNCLVEYDEIFYWIGIDRVLMYNGVVKEVPNNFNINYFFDNLNWTYRNKVYGYKIPRFGEIRWAFPLGSSVECNHEIVLNVREGYWYDTEIPNGGRSAAATAQIIRFPLMSGVVGTTGSPGSFKLWQHEFGVDEVDGATTTAINSFFETSDINNLLGELLGKPFNKQVGLETIEPDFVLSGALQIQVIGRPYAMAPDEASEIYTFDPANFNPQQLQTYIQNMRQQRRLLRVRFTSNVVGGNYQMGQVIGQTQLGDTRAG